jgi:hypothetical protein
VQCHLVESGVGGTEEQEVVVEQKTLAAVDDDGAGTPVSAGGASVRLPHVSSKEKPLLDSGASSFDPEDGDSSEDPHLRRLSLAPEDAAQQLSERAQRMWQVHPKATIAVAATLAIILLGAHLLPTSSHVWCVNMTLRVANSFLAQCSYMFSPSTPTKISAH